LSINQDTSERHFWIGLDLDRGDKCRKQKKNN
jgi:hypothetical protein